MKADLHIHSEFSDGKYAPPQIIEYAAQSGLDVIALTDHDTVDGISEAVQAGQRYPALRVIAGVEVSTWLEQHELHILGYGIDSTHAGLLSLLRIAQNNRQSRILRTLENLRANHIRLEIADVKNGFRSVSLGRMHVAQALLNRGHVATIREAFDRYLSYETGVVELRQSDFVGAQQAVETILAAGGVPVLAHPSLEMFDRYLNTLISFGLKGIEVFKTMRSSIEEFYFETVGHDKRLLVTGGSDWHGHHIPPKLGSFYVDSARIKPFLEALHIT